MQNILIIDSAPSAELVNKLRQRYVVNIAGSLQYATSLLDTSKVDLAISALNFSDGSIVDILRKTRYEIPIIVLADNNDEKAYLDCLSLGVSDYLIMPVSVNVIEKYVDIRISKKIERYLYSGNLVIDQTKCIVKYNDKSAKLTATEMDILLYLFKNNADYHTAKEIYEHLYGDMFLESTSMRMHLSHLRSKLLEIAPSEAFITTLYGKGYKFISR